MMNDTNRIRAIECNQLLDMKHCIASGIFLDAHYPYEVIPKIHEYIISLGNSLSLARFEKRDKDIWISKTAKVAPTACIEGPCIIDEGAEIRHGAYIRGDVIVGKNTVVGNSTELKNVILFDGVQVPHYNYVGDSILGYLAHMGAGSITSNVKSDKSLIEVHYGQQKLRTHMKKFGAVLGDRAEIGCNAVLNPGTIIGRDSMVYPTSSVRGYVPNQSMYKSNGKDLIVPKQNRDR